MFLSDSTYQYFGAFFFSDFNVFHYLIELGFRNLSTNHRFGIQRTTIFNGFNAFDYALGKCISDAFMNQYSRRRSTDFPLVKRKEYRSLNGFVEKFVVGFHDGWEENIW